MDKIIVERPLFYFVTALYVLTVLISAGDTYNYFLNDYGLLKWVNLGLNIGMLVILPFFLNGLINIKVAVGIVVYGTMGVIFFTNIFFQQTSVDIWEHNYLRDIPILFVYMLPLCLVLHARHIIVYNLFYIAYCILIYAGANSSYIIENTPVIICSLLAFSYLMFFFLNRLKGAVSQNAELKERIRLEEEEALKAKISSKDRELTFQAMMLASNSETSEHLISKLNALKSDLTGSEDKKKLRQIISDIKFTEKKDIWTEFQLRFSEVHQFFFKNLLKDFPCLTQNDIKLASLLKLNLSSKEISILIGNTRESVDVSRSRLRKKMKLEKGETLSSLLNRY